MFEGCILEKNTQTEIELGDISEEAYSTILVGERAIHNARRRIQEN